MIRALTMPGLVLVVFAIAILLAPQGSYAQNARVNGAPSHWAIGKVNGIPTMLHDGAPFLIVGAQCDLWRSLERDAKTVEFFDGFRDMNATTVSVGIPWSKIETEEGKYDFSFFDWYIRQAEAHHLKLLINLFNSNVCGKIGHFDTQGGFVSYVPKYILANPAKYQRMVLHTKYNYDAAGPPMCPNDPNTLDRECRLVVQVAEHLKATDALRTVIMMQLDNEFYYQQWNGERPPYASDEEKAIRCECPYCSAKYDPAKYKTGEDFMFKSFADYVKGLTDAIRSVYDIPLYINSPWWQTYVIPIFLDRCSNLNMVGIDGILTPREPNWLSTSQVGRNIPFAAENPTENLETRYNLGVLPYYTIVGRQGIGNLLWECHPPFTVVYDPDARRRYGNACYPIKNAMSPIARARGTDRLIGWFKQFELVSDGKTDASGNIYEPDKSKSVIRHQSLFVREGLTTRTTDESRFEAASGDIRIRVSGTDAGIIVRTGPKQLVLATPRATVKIIGARGITAEQGRFIGDNWTREKDYPVAMNGETATIEVGESNVIRLTCR